MDGGTDAGSDAGHDSGSDAGLEAGVDAAGTCTALPTVSSTMIPAYEPPARAAVCSMAQINAFVTACASSTGSNTACSAWANDPANSACDTCVVQTADAGVGSNTGALLFDSNNQPFALNLGGCIALADPTNGPACGMAVDLLFQCENAACDSAACVAAPLSDVQACQATSQQGACASQLATATSSCAIDLGDGGVGNTTCGTSAGIIAEICGNGM
jgi:hypothetical protein